jgi:hypothetical protein
MNQKNHSLSTSSKISSTQNDRQMFVNPQMDHSLSEVDSHFPLGKDSDFLLAMESDFLLEQDSHLSLVMESDFLVERNSQFSLAMESYCVGQQDSYWRRMEAEVPLMMSQNNQSS